MSFEIKKKSTNNFLKKFKIVPIFIGVIIGAILSADFNNYSNNLVAANEQKIVELEKEIEDKNKKYQEEAEQEYAESILNVTNENQKIEEELIIATNESKSLDEKLKVKAAEVQAKAEAEAKAAEAQAKAEAEAQAKAEAEAQAKAEAEAQAQAEAEAQAQAQPQPQQPTENFANCTELRKVYPSGVSSDHPAYKTKMDRDNDGWACEVS